MTEEPRHLERSVQGEVSPVPPLQEGPRSPYEPKPRNISNDDTDILPLIRAVNRRARSLTVC